LLFFNCTVKAAVSERVLLDLLNINTTTWQVVNENEIGGVPISSFGVTKRSGGLSWRGIAEEQRRVRLGTIASRAVPTGGGVDQGITFCGAMRANVLVTGAIGLVGRAALA
jgi:hypothetical protein